MYPALAVVAALREQAEVLWVGGRGGIEEQLVPRDGLRFEAIPAAGVHGVGLRALPGNVYQLVKGYRAARGIVRAYQPEAMLFTGGYVGVAVALAGSGVPKVSYVPDLNPGLALQVTARLSEAVAVTAPASRQGYGPRRVIVTGYPDSEIMSEALKVGPFAIVRKPFSLEQLSHIVERLLPDQAGDR